MGSHDEGHPKTVIKEIHLSPEESYPHHVMVRQGKHGRVYDPPSDIILEYRAALLWCAQHAWEGGDIDGGDFQSEMIERGILVEVPASQEFKDEWDTDVMYVVAWSDDAN